MITIALSVVPATVVILIILTVELGENMCCTMLWCTMLWCIMLLLYKKKPTASHGTNQIHLYNPLTKITELLPIHIIQLTDHVS